MIINREMSNGNSNSFVVLLSLLRASFEATEVEGDFFTREPNFRIPRSLEGIFLLTRLEDSFVRQRVA